MTDHRQYCTFTLADGFFGIDVADVQEVLRDQVLTSVPLAHETISGLINLRGQIVTAIDLRTRLQLEERGPEEIPMTIVVRTIDGRVALLVDRIGDVLVADTELFESPPETIVSGVRELLTGVCKLEKQLLLILDLARTVDISDSAENAAALVA